MESSKCESADNTDTEQLATVHCTKLQQNGGGSAPATAKADRLAAERLQKKHRRAEEPLKSVLHGCRAIYHSAQGAAIKLAQL